VYVAKAYMNAYKSDYKAAILKRVDEKYSQEPLVLLALEMRTMVTKSK
jgi:hypothetical protein